MQELYDFCWNEMKKKGLHFCHSVLCLSTLWLWWFKWLNLSMKSKLFILALQIFVVRASTRMARCFCSKSFNWEKFRDQEIKPHHITLYKQRFFHCLVIRFIFNLKLRNQSTQAHRWWVKWMLGAPSFEKNNNI